MKVAVFRLRALDKELAEMLNEADGRCSTDFALMLDDLREQLGPKLNAIARSEARIARKYADQDGKGNPKPDEQGRLLYTTADQQDSVNDAFNDLAMSVVEIPDDLPKLSKGKLAANGLHTSGTRISNLRPLLDLSIPDEPGQANRDERSVIIPAARRMPNA